MVTRRPQECAEPPPFRRRRLQGVRGQAQEEGLRQVLRVRPGMASAADVGIHGVPISATECLERVAGVRRSGVGRGENDAPVEVCVTSSAIRSAEAWMTPGQSCSVGFGGWRKLRNRPPTVEPFSARGGRRNTSHLLPERRHSCAPQDKAPLGRRTGVSASPAER